MLYATRYHMLSPSTVLISIGGVEPDFTSQIYQYKLGSTASLVSNLICTLPHSYKNRDRFSSLRTLDIYHVVATLNIFYRCIMALLKTNLLCTIYNSLKQCHRAECYQPNFLVKLGSMSSIFFFVAFQILIYILYSLQ